GDDLQADRVGAERVRIPFPQDLDLAIDALEARDVTDLRQHPETPQQRDGTVWGYRAAGPDIHLAVEESVAEGVEHPRPERRDLGLIVCAAIDPQRLAGRS